MTADQSTLVIQDREASGPQGSGVLIINADDWGRQPENTDRTLECILQHAVSSVSAMVFMEDSERAAAIARERGIDSGLHLNLTSPFSAPNVPRHIVEHQQRIASHLLRYRFSPVLFHPGLRSSFEYVVANQLEEYQRLYGAPPERIDGHHHMHLCANVLFGRLLPAGTVTRRNFSFRPGEKSWSNRTYRAFVDRKLASRHRLTDFFFSLPPLDPPERLRRIFDLARDFVVEVEAHPIRAEEYRFLTEGGLSRLAGNTAVAHRHLSSSPTSASNGTVGHGPVCRAPEAGRNEPYIVGADDLILITGANGFIGSRVVENLVNRGFRNLRCFARPTSNSATMEALRRGGSGPARIEMVRGNLLSPEDCAAATKDVKVIFHLAAGRGEKSYPDAFANSAVTTRNLLEASLQHQCLRRFVNVSSFAVYSNREKPGGRLLDESSPIESRPELRGEAYCFAKIKQDEIVTQYGREFDIPYVIVRPGYVYGPGKQAITDRVGIDTFGLFLHCGGSNPIPFTYVDNCAEAIVLAGLKPGIEDEVFNVVDDDLPTSRQFLRLYKKKVRNFRSLYVPHAVSFALSYLWEQYSIRSDGQLPPAFNCRRWHCYWKRTRYSNQKLKSRIGWKQRVPTPEGLERYFEGCSSGKTHV